MQGVSGLGFRERGGEVQALGFNQSTLFFAPGL